MILYAANLLLPEMGMASANRVKSLARGLCEFGEKVDVFCPFCDSGKKGDFSIGATRCHALFNSTENRVLYALIWRFLFPIKLIFAIRSEKHIKCIVGYSYSVQLLCALWFVSKLFRVPYFREVSEYPIYMIKPTRFNWFGLRDIMEKYVIPKLFDGMVTMTRHVEEFYRPLAKKRCRFLKLPMTVDCSRFIDKGISPYEFPYIAYCGSMSCDRKGMINLVDAFANVAMRFPNLHLVLIGCIDDIAKSEILQNITEKGVLSRIIFTGMIPASEVPRFIGNAKILALIRPANKQAEGGFPTKLGEYLATAVPTVVTRVGEIDDFLTDRENVYFAVPDSTESVSSCFFEILDNYEDAVKIGLNGRNAAYKYFNYSSAGASLSRFINGGM